jgi:hypothetical protein
MRPLGQRLRPVDELIDRLNEQGRRDWTVRAIVERARNRQIPALVKINGRWTWDEGDLNEILSALPEKQAAR